MTKKADGTHRRKAKRLLWVALVIAGLFVSEWLICKAFDVPLLVKICATSVSTNAVECPAYGWPIGHLLYIVKLTDIYNGAVQALAALIVAVFTFFLMKVANKQAALTEDQRDIAGRQRDIAAAQTDILERQQGLAHWQAIASHRPRLIMRRVQFDIPEGWNLEVRPGHAVVIAFALVNQGGSEAKIVEANTSLSLMSQKIDIKTPLDGSAYHLHQERIDAGEAKLFRYNSRIIFENVGQFHQLTAGTKFLYFHGFVRYSDPKDVVRSISFCRKYNPDAKRFEPMDDIDLENAS